MLPALSDGGTKTGCIESVGKIGSDHALDRAQRVDAVDGRSGRVGERRNGPGGKLDGDWPQCIGLPLGGVEIDCEILAIPSSQGVVAGSAAKRVVAVSARQRIAARITKRKSSPLPPLSVSF